MPRYPREGDRHLGGGRDEDVHGRIRRHHQDGVPGVSADMQVGEYTIVHAGFAITRLDEASAHETLRMFAELGVLDEELAGEQPLARRDPA